MALTQVVRLRLESAGFRKLFDDHRQDWENLAEQARKLIGGQVQGHAPTVDDIKKVLFPLIELNPHLRTFLTSGRKPLTQLYWVNDFTDYVLDRVYQPTLTPPKETKK
ncbi:MAG: hypothetical protein WA734_07180 [Candidatus Acidiferrales bacterium]